MSTFRLDLERQKQLTHYIVAKHPEGISRLKLRCLLYLVDLEHYRREGRPITGARYRRGKRGPIVEGLTRTLRTLRAEGAIT